MHPYKDKAGRKGQRLEHGDDEDREKEREQGHSRDGPDDDFSM